MAPLAEVTVIRGITIEVLQVAFPAREGRFRAVERLDPHRYHELCARAEREVLHRIELYAQLSHLNLSAATDASLGKVAST